MQLERASQASRYLQRQLAHPPACFDPAALERPLSEELLRALLQLPPDADESRLAHTLRQARQATMMQVIARDLSGAADLAEVMRSVTWLAEHCVALAARRLHAILAEARGEPIGADTGRPQRLLVLGMGKLGGCELNVSSDIDLIFLYDEDGQTAGPRPLSNHEFFTRLGRKLINALSELTADGFVFRVDMRLRPYGDSGPLVMSLRMLENYLLTQGREWERYAWVKAREVAGAPETAIAALEALTAPFVYRRHLDFSAIASLRDLHAQIRAEVARRELHDNIKLGPGGIREIEFTAQVFQLIRGGRDSGLRVRPTLAALDALAARGLLPAQAAEELKSAYVFLRNLEHRVQYLDDQQTQMLPASPADRALLAQSMGFEDERAFSAALERHRGNVSRHFEAVFAGDSRSITHPLAAIWTGQISEADARARLTALGYTQPDEVLQRLRALHESAAYRRMAASTQARVDRLVPRLLEAAAAHPPARILPRAAARVSRGPGAAGRAGGSKPMGERVLGAPPDPARRADLPASLRCAGLARARGAPARRAGRPCRQHRAAARPPAPLQAGADAALAHAGPGRHASARDAERPLERPRLLDPATGAAPVLGRPAHASSRRAALRRDRVWQARRQGAGLCLRSGLDLPVRRRPPGRARGLRAAVATAQHLAHQLHAGRRAV
jgi:glutamate-ammonia-ligase adenylyltransferase